MLTLLLLAAACLLAYANGANDNFKGVASLFGSETSDYRGALLWGTATTFLGSIASIYLAQSLVRSFSGKGLVPDSVAATEPFMLAVAVGAGATVLLATRLGFPISTTHSLVGAIVGAGWLAAGSALDLGVLASTFVLPLLLSPFIALALAGVFYWTLHATRRRLGIDKERCVCVGEATRATSLGATPAGALATSAAFDKSPADLRVTIDTPERCAERYVGQFLGVRINRLVDGAHYMSAGLVSFARGLNDTPKIAALLVVIQVADIRWGLAVVGLVMATGGLISARHVAITVAKKITDMNHGQGFAANLATGALVIGASRLGMPVSTTHVSVGSLFGIGLTTGQADLGVVRNVVLSWIVTLPCAAIVAGLTYGAIGTLV